MASMDPIQNPRVCLATFILSWNSLLKGFQRFGEEGQPHVSIEIWKKCWKCKRKCGITVHIFISLVHFPRRTSIWGMKKLTLFMKKRANQMRAKWFQLVREWIGGHVKMINPNPKLPGWAWLQAPPAGLSNWSISLWMERPWNLRSGKQQSNITGQF